MCCLHWSYFNLTADPLYVYSTVGMMKYPDIKAMIDGDGNQMYIYNMLSIKMVRVVWGAKQPKAEWQPAGHIICCT